MAVSEYAKSRGKSSSSAVSASTPVSADIATGGTQLLRSTLYIGLAAAGMSMSLPVMAEVGVGGGSGSGTAISKCTTTSTQANSGAATQNIAIGCSASTDHDGSLIADRKNPYYTSDSSASSTVPVGDRNTYTPSSQNAGAVAIGTGAKTEKALSLAIGEYARATDIGGMAIGVGALSKGNTALSIGRQSAAIADYAQAIGNVSAAVGKGSLAIGHSATATGYRAIAIGAPDIENADSTNPGQQLGNSYQTVGQTKASAKDSIAFGGGAQATAENALSIGAYSQATAEKSVAIGTGAKATATNAVVIGEGANTAVSGGVALGLNSRVNGINSAALGRNSIAEAQSGASFLTNVAATTQGTVSFGNTSEKRRLTNLADGAIDSDAVTVAQLKKQNLLSNKQGEDTAAALGGGSTYNPITGAVTLPKYNVDGNEVTNVGAAITNIDGRTTTNSNNIANLQNQTFKIQANNDTATAVAADATVSFKDGNNIKVNRNGNNITIGTADDINVNSVTAKDANGNETKLTATGTSVTDGTSTSNYGADGFTITGGPSVTSAGIDAGNKKITNVDNGSVVSGSKEAINGGQLFNTADSVTSVIGGNASNTNGVISATNIGGTGQDNINDAISNVKGAATAAKTTVTQGENILVTETIDQTTGASNYEVKTKRDLALDSVTTGNSVLNNDGITITDGSNITAVTSTGTNVTDGTNTSNYGATGLTITGGPSVTSAGIDAGNKKITNVDNGSVVSGSKEAINGGQLFNTADSVTSVIGGNASNTNGVISATNIGGTGQDNINDAISNVKGAATAAKTTVTQGENILVTETIDQTTGASNYEVKTKRDLDLDSVTAKDANGNETKLTATGTNVTDGTNTSNYGANGFTATDAAGNNGITINQGGVSFIDGTGQQTGPSITAGGINAGNQKITNVDNGSVLTGSKDAINGGQLFDSAESVKNVIGGNTVNNGGLITSTDIGGTGADTIHGAISNVKNAATAAKTTVTQGENILVTETVDQTTGASSYEVKTKRDLDLDSVTAKDANGNETKLTATGTNVTDGTNTSNYGANGFTATDAAGNTTVFNQGGVSFIDVTGMQTGPSISVGGLNAGGTVITNVGDAIKATDAVNKGQLDNLADGAVQYERDPITNAINYDKVVLAGTPAVIGKDANGNNIVISGGTSLGNVANGVNASDAVNKGQLDSAQNALTNAGLSFAGDSGTNVKRKLGETLNITGGAKAPLTTGNIGVVANGKDGLLVQLAKDIDLGADGSVKTGNTVTNNEGVKVDDGKGNSTTITTAGTNVVDDEGNSADYTATGSELVDKDGNTNISTAKGNTITNGDNVTTITGKGTNVVDNATGNSADYGANGFIATDAAGNTTIFNQGGVSFIDGTGMQTGPSISVGGINAGGTVITNVGDAVKATDAVNKGQLDKVTAEANGKTDALGNSTANNLGGGATYDSNTGTVNAPTYNLDNGSVNVNNVGDALTNLDDRITSNTDNIADLAAGKAGLVQQQTPTDSITVGAATGGTSVDFTGKDGDRVLTGVANGTVAAGSNDVVTGDQLNNTANSIVSVIGGNAKNEGGVITTTDIGGTGKNTIDDAIASLKDGENASNDNIQANTDRLDAGLSFGADNGADINKPIGDGTALKFEGSDNITTTTTGSGIKFDLSGNISVDSVTTGNTTVNNNGVSIKDGPSMTVDGIYAGNKTITGVADGIEVNDAVNLGQLNALDQRVSNSVNELGYKIGEVEDGANAGISAAMAMSSLPQAYIPGKSMIGGGVATYNGQSAVAVGISRVSDNGRWVIKANGTADTQGNAGGAIGAGFHF